MPPTSAQCGGGSNMKKIFLWIIIVLAVLVAAFYALNSYIYNEKQGEGLPQDFKEVTFTITGEPVTLKDGVAEVQTVFGQEAHAVVRYFGNEVSKDLDGDGMDDVAFLISQETDDRTYFYVVGALKREGGYIGSKAVLLDTNPIAPQTTEKGEGRMIIVNYAEVPEDSTQPSMGKSVWLLLDPETLEFGEVVQNFEGESR